MIVYTQSLYSGTVTASGNSQSAPIIVRYAKECAIFLDITAASGTNPTLDITIQIYDKLSEKWYTLATFTQKTGTGQDVGYVEYGLGEKMAVKWVVGGTNTPTFTFAVNATFKEK